MYLLNRNKNIGNNYIYWQPYGYVFTVLAGCCYNLLIYKLKNQPRYRERYVLILPSKIMENIYWYVTK